LYVSDELPGSLQAEPVKLSAPMDAAMAGAGAAAMMAGTLQAAPLTTERLLGGVDRWSPLSDMLASE
jgi:hypothetical protein